MSVFNLSTKGLMNNEEALLGLIADAESKLEKLDTEMAEVRARYEATENRAYLTTLSILATKYRALMAKNREYTKDLNATLDELNKRFVERNAQLRAARGVV